MLSLKIKNCYLARQIKSLDISDKGNEIFGPQPNNEDDPESRITMRRSTLQIIELETKKMYYLSRENSLGERLSLQMNPDLYRQTMEVLDPSFDMSFGNNNNNKLNSPNSEKKQSQSNDDNL